MASSGPHGRVVALIDVDYFYAQVEELKDTSLANKPVGVKQKNCIVTCNYIAREFGIKKCMSVSEGLSLCPVLKLVCGEDLTDYRNYSNRIFELLQSYGQNVEKSGLDEYYIDLTQLVKEHKPDEPVQVMGHIFGNTRETCNCGCFERLCTGSKIAQGIRERIKSSIGLTTSCGISFNKLLAKIGGSVNKPFQQTTIFPCSATDLISSLKDNSFLPGVGIHTFQILKSMGIITINDLRSTPLETLVARLKYSLAKRLKNLALGLDNSPVIGTGRAKSIGVEDACKITNTAQLNSKISELLKRLQVLLLKDGRCPSTIKVTLRGHCEKTGHKSRMSRQCVINFNPKLAFFEIGSHTFKVALDLVKKMVDVSKTIHLSLLGVSFSNLSNENFTCPTRNLFKKSSLTCDGLDGQVSPLKAQEMETKNKEKDRTVLMGEESDVCSKFGFDKTIFDELPSDIKTELLLRTPLKNEPIANQCEIIEGTGSKIQSKVQSNESDEFCRKRGFDKAVFDELPDDIKTELCASSSPKPKVKKAKQCSILNYVK